MGSDVREDEGIRAVQESLRKLDVTGHELGEAERIADEQDSLAVEIARLRDRQEALETERQSHLDAAETAGTAVTVLMRERKLSAVAEAIRRAGWPELRELPPITESVPNLPDELIPAPFAPWIKDAAERLCVPLEYVAVPAIVVAGSVVGRACSLRPRRRDDWSVVPNLWGAIVGPPAFMKSPAIEAAMRPMKALARKARAMFKEAAFTAALNAEEREARLAARSKEMAKAARGGDERGIAAARDAIARLREPEAEPTERRFATNDATTEKIAELLNQNPRGLLLLRDELTGLLSSLEKTGREGDRAFYLESWNGTASFNVDRIGRGSLHVDGLSLSILGGIQPDRLRDFFSGAMANGGEADGLLQRFQALVWPDELGEWRLVDRWPDGDAYVAAVRIFELLESTDAIAFGAKAEENVRPFLRFAPEAQALFDEWLTRIMGEVRGPAFQKTPGFAVHIGKYPALLPKLAVIFHLMDVASGVTPAGPVTLRATQLAAAWCDFLRLHARKVFAPELRGDLTAAHALAAKIRDGKVTDKMTVRDIYRREWTGLRSSAVVFAALDVLEGLGWARVENEATGGRDAVLIRLNPALEEKP